jgi:predicted N-acetyltransferase YhbS
MMTIRRARVADAPLLRELTKSSIVREAERYPEDRIGISAAGLDNLETRYRLGAVHADLLTLVAEEDGRIVGLLDTEITRDRGLPGVTGEILDLHLAEDRADVAEALAQRAVELLRERGARVIIHTESADHPDSQPWESLGFVADVVRYSLYD